MHARRLPAFRGAPSNRRYMRATFLFQVGQHGIPCLQVLLLRIRVVPRRESVQRPYPHLRGLLLVLLQVSSSTSVCILALSAGSRGECAALCPHSARWQFLEPRCVRAGPLLEQCRAGPVSSINCCAEPDAQQLHGHCFSHSPILCALHLFSAGPLFATFRCCLQECL